VKKIVKVIPCLDMKDGRVVKGIKFVNLRDARDPVEAATAYEKQGGDEIAFLDIAATVEKRGTRLEWVRSVRKAITVPFVVGGGIRNTADMQELFNIGVNKVSINTAAYRNPDLVAEAVRKFGADKIVVAIDGKKNPPKSKRPRLELVVSGGMEETGVEIVEWAKKVEKLGAGEILLTSRDADGTKEGYDLEMTKAVAEAVKIPVTASGGAGKLEHLYEAVTIGKASAVLCASVFHFGEITIPQAKKYLASKGIPVRL
jgi:cyclase